MSLIESRAQPWRIWGGGGGVPGARHLQDPILLFSHTFSPKSARIGGPRPPPLREILDPPLHKHVSVQLQRLFTACLITATSLRSQGGCCRDSEQIIPGLIGGERQLLENKFDHLYAHRVLDLLRDDTVS